MKIVSVNGELLDEYRKIDPEVLEKHNRPCLLVMRLKYAGRKRMFAVPFRSNIVSNAPKNHYFPLPPRSATRTGNRHGLHYVKMLPVSKHFLERYRIDTSGALLYATIVSKNEKLIINACQAYLEQYEQGNRPPYSTSLDKLIAKLECMEANHV